MENNLKKYFEKRNFKQSPEPQSMKSSKKNEKPIFVIQKHDASNLHYDFRLEVGGVLKSWAIPKGPSVDPKEKRLAIQTEDHPMDYADFEGVIPEDQYGGGVVMVWDKGNYKNLNEKEFDKSLRAGKIAFELFGKKIKGKFLLSKFGKEKDQWLLIKVKDEYADGRRNPTSTQNKSVKTDRTMNQIRKNSD